MKKIIFFLCFILFNLSALGETAETPFFDITNLTETFLKTEINKAISNPYEDKIKTFDEAVLKFNQGNVTTAYDDYSKIIDMTKTDFGLLNLAKTLYKTGLFSLGNQALDKIEKKEEMANFIADLKSAGSTKNIGKDDEIYLGKALTSILYDNSASETIYDLNKREDILKKSDWANYVAANGYLQMKQYKQAMSFVDKAISKNQNNNLYILLKLKIYTLQEDYKQALKYAQNVEKDNLIKIAFLDEFTIQKKVILQNLAKDKNDKLLYKAEISILKNDIYSAKETLEEIIGTDNKNQKAIALLGFCNLKLNDLTSAENNFKKLSEIKANSSIALEGYGDIEFINYRYKNALKYYEKAYKKDKKNISLLNKVVLSAIFSQEPEIATKTTKLYSKKGNAQFYDFYNIGTTTAKYLQKDRINLSDEYIKKSITINPFWNVSWLEFSQREFENDNIAIVQNILDAVYLSLNADYRYYYLNGLLEYRKGNKEGALDNIEKAIEMNPNYKPATELKDIINDKI